MIEISLKKQLSGPSGEMLLDVSFDISKGEFISLYGMSGAGKTSILRMLAGLMAPESGKIVVDGEVWFDSGNGVNIAPQRRGIGFVFQENSLFPNMTVVENLEFATGQGRGKNAIPEIIDIMELGPIESRLPESLSGGQKQRAALARAIIRKPRLLLLDEPLSALDREIRRKLQDYIFQLHQQYDLTTILVSHDVSEVLKLSNRVIQIDNGQIEKEGRPIDVFGAKDVSGKFQFTGEVLKIDRQDFIYILSLLVGNDLVKVIADKSDAESLQIGDKVLVASKAFNPIIRKL